MKKGMIARRAALAAVAVAISCFAARGAIATPANMNLTSPGSSVTGTNVLDGVYTGAYTATINGVSTPVVCDDFFDDSYVPETWTATVNTFSTLSQAKWSTLPGYTQLYEEAAYLVEQMYANSSNGATVSDISFAIWDLFDSGATAGLSSTDLNAVNAWLKAAANPANLATVNFADFTIYTPTKPSDAKCPSYPNSTCPNTPPQEFITYSATEPGFFGILGVDMLLFGCGVLLLRRRGLLKLAA